MSIKKKNQVNWNFNNKHHNTNFGKHRSCCKYCGDLHYAESEFCSIRCESLYKKIIKNKEVQ